WNTLGVAHYRSEEWEAAIQALEECEKLAAGKYFACNAFFLAMCHHQLGDTATARDYYDRAVRWWRGNQEKLSAQQQQELKAFGAEAEALLAKKTQGPVGRFCSPSGKTGGFAKHPAGEAITKSGRRVLTAKQAPAGPAPPRRSVCAPATVSHSILLRTEGDFTMRLKKQSALR